MKSLELCMVSTPRKRIQFHAFIATRSIWIWRQQRLLWGYKHLNAQWSPNTHIRGTVLPLMYFFKYEHYSLIHNLVSTYK